MPKSGLSERFRCTEASVRDRGRAVGDGHPCSVIISSTSIEVSSATYRPGSTNRAAANAPDCGRPQQFPWNIGVISMMVSSAVRLSD